MQTHPVSLATRQLLVAPFIGALAGFLFNRMHAGSTGWALIGEMFAGALLCTIGAAILSQLDALSRESRRRSLLRQLAQAKQDAALVNARRNALIEAEQTRYFENRVLIERQLVADRRAQGLEAELSETRRDTVKLANVVAGLVSHMRNQSGGIEVIHLAQEAKARMAALEVAHRELETRQVELDRKTATEAEEVKTRLLQLSISDSQRQRNVAAPEVEGSGRLIELEARIKKLAREIERLSIRQPSSTEAGEASKVAQGGTQNGARLGFLKAMLEANQTLRKQIQEAA